jgi:hypothetical protein
MFDQSGTGRDPSLEYEWRSAWEPLTRLCTIDMEFRAFGPNGTRVFRERHVQKGYTYAEIQDGLDTAGFEVLALFEAFTQQAPTPRTDRIYVVARA